MANTFKNYTASGVGTTPVTVYTVPASTTAIVIGATLANVGAGSVNADLQIAGSYMLKTAEVPAGMTLSALDGKIVLEAGDQVVVTSSASSSLDVVISVLEQS